MQKSLQLVTVCSQARPEPSAASLGEGQAEREREGREGICGSYSVIAIVALDKAKPKATALGKNILWKSGTID